MGKTTSPRANKNHVSLLGKIHGDPHPYTHKDIDYVRFTLVTEGRRGYQEHHRILISGEGAHMVEDELLDGDLVAIEGRLQYRHRFVGEDQPRRREAEVFAYDILPLGSD